MRDGPDRGLHGTIEDDGGMIEHFAGALADDNVFVNTLVPGHYQVGLKDESP